MDGNAANYSAKEGGDEPTFNARAGGSGQANPSTRRRSKLMPRESYAYEVQTSEFTSLTLLNAASTACFSLGAGLFSFYAQMPEIPSAVPPLTAADVHDSRELIRIVSFVFFFFGVVALLGGNHITRRIKRESGEPNFIVAFVKWLADTKKKMKEAWNG